MTEDEIDQLIEDRYGPGMADEEPPERHHPLHFFCSWINGGRDLEYVGHIYWMHWTGAGRAELERGDTMSFTRDFLARCTLYDNSMHQRAAVRQWLKSKT